MILKKLHLQDEGNIINKKFDSKKHQEGRYLPFFPAVRCNFGDFCLVIQKEIFIICKTEQQQQQKLSNPFFVSLQLLW